MRGSVSYAGCRTHGAGVIMIVLEEVSKSYDEGNSFAVSQLSFEVHQREFFVLLGESGCGKTTTMKMINRLIEITSGRISVDERNVDDFDPVELRRHIGYVFQGIGLFPHLTVAENVATIPRLLRWPSDRVGQRVEELLDRVQLPAEQFGARMPRELSGGQQQRVGVARALAGNANIMLMDEPFGALDPINRDVLQSEYGSLHRELGLTSVMVTHDMIEALLLADRIGVMSSGRLVQVGTPSDLMNRPDDESVERLMNTATREVAFIQQLQQDDGKNPADGGPAEEESQP
jgi:osmoprotectant transport system ATP-binding protein